MKKVISSLLMLSMAFLGSVAKADNVTVDQAKAIGAYYMSYQMGGGADKITSEQLMLAYQFENPDMNVASAYLFNVNGGGWIIIAGSSVMDPVIAYSTECSLDMSDIPDNMRWWLTGYTNVIADIQLMDAERDYPDSEEYTTLASKSLKNGTKNQSIKLMSSEWNQGDDYNPTYNLYCPMVSGRYSVTGCVATALAQMCKYYEYPVQPKGIVSYDWQNTDEGTTQTLRIKLDTVQFDYSLMPNRLLSTSSAEKIHQVAMLNYCLGVALHMDYHPDGSAANMIQANTIMKTKFKYQQGSNRHRNGVNDTSFLNTIRRYLMNGDVIVMSGSSSTGSGADAAGHAWVVDGYQTENEKMYHMNWGWGGSGNAFFNLADNNMRISSMGYNFNVDQACLFGVIPPEDSNIRHNHVAIRNVEDNTFLGTAYPNPAALSVALPYTTEIAADMQIYGIDGKLIATRRVLPGTGEVTLCVDALPKGVYVYRLNSQSGKFIVR